MHRQKTSSPAIFLLFFICTSCTSYEISPQIDNNTPAATGQEISNFTYSITSPWKNTRFGKSAYKATTLILPRAKDISNTATTIPDQTLEIIILERSSGGACIQEYLTGLSLGLIPSTCTRQEIYKFSFVLANRGSICSHEIYSVNSKTFSHILALPFTTFNSGNTPITLYNSALNNFINHGKCEATNN